MLFKAAITVIVVLYYFIVCVIGIKFAGYSDRTDVVLVALAVIATINVFTFLTRLYF